MAARLSSVYNTYMLGQYKCPGSFGSGTPVITLKRCPRCSGEVELFSIDMRIDCPTCGQPVFNNVNSCVKYCRHAEQCLGTEIYRKLKK